MRRRGKAVAFLTILTWGVGAMPPEARAVFHLAVIDELLASLDGDADQQLVEIRMLAPVQNVVANTVLAVFDVNGAHVDDLFVVPSNVANDGTGGRWIMATAAFQDAQGFTADFTIPAGLPVDGGMVCWGAPGIVPPADPESWDHTVPANYVDCLAYGSYAGPSNVHVGTPTPLRPEGHALVRVGESDDNAADFACADPATPTNNAGATVSVPASEPCAEERGSGIQTTPDGKRILISKDVGGERWAITRNVDDQTVTGNVFFPAGGDPLFLWCEQTDAAGGDLTFDCFGTDRCGETSCPAFDFISEVTLPESFFEGPFSEEAPLGGHEHAHASGAPGREETARVRTARPSGVEPRASGIQITPDELRVLISKDVGGERWAITRNLDDQTVTGNVFFPAGGDPLFLWCEQTGTSGSELTFDCFGTDACSSTACPEYAFISEVTLDVSFFTPPTGGATPAPAPTATPAGTNPPEPSDAPTPAPTAAPTPDPTPEPTPDPTPDPPPPPTPYDPPYPY